MIQEKYRCVVDGEDCDFFVPGKVYDVNDDGSVKSEDGDTYRPMGGRPVVQWLAEDYGYEFEKLPMREQLMNGDVVETRNGNRYICLQHGGSDHMRLYRNGGQIDLTTNDLSTLKDTNHRDEWDIVNVYRPSDKSTNPFDNLTVISQGDFHQIWTEPRRMTLADVCDVLGYDIEIIKEEK